MADLIFLTSGGLFQRSLDGTISRSFFCECLPLDLDSGLDPNSILWVLVKSGEKLFLQSRLKVDLIQRFDEGRMSGWYLISCSASIGGHIAESEFEIEVPTSTLNHPVSLNSLITIAPPQSDKLQSLYQSSIRRTSLSIEKDLRRRPLKDFLSQNKADLLAFDMERLENEIRMRFFESELAINVVFSFEVDVFRSSAGEAYAFLHNLPLSDLYVATGCPPGQSNLSNKASGYSVDCRLRPFSEDDFVARTMVWNPANYNPEKAKLGLLKTNLAEKRHQQMLKNLVAYLTNAGFVPVGSSSIDLAVECSGIIHLFEIKSATEDNHKDQALKGCGQLAEYAYVFNKQNSQQVKRHLVIETPQRGDIDLGYVKDICLLMGSNLIEFKFESSWPDRCQVLREISL